MSFRILFIPARGDFDAEAELNRFLNNHRVLSVERRLIEQGDSSFWTFCVDYLEGSSRSGDRSAKPSSGRSRIDYREVLSPADFAVFAKLRDLRKEFANTEGIPLYNIFTNEHLARMVTERMQSKADLRKIEGLGDARIEKYADRFLDVLKESRTSGDGGNETSQPAV